MIVETLKSEGRIMEQKLFTVDECAIYLRIHPKTVRSLIYLGEEEGGLRCVRIGRAVRVEKEALDEFIARNVAGRCETSKLLNGHSALG